MGLCGGPAHIHMVPGSEVELLGVQRDSEKQPVAESRCLDQVHPARLSPPSVIASISIKSLCRTCGCCHLDHAGYLCPGGGGACIQLIPATTPTSNQSRNASLTVLAGWLNLHLFEGCQPAHTHADCFQQNILHAPPATWLLPAQF